MENEIESCGIIENVNVLREVLSVRLFAVLGLSHGRFFFGLSRLQDLHDYDFWLRGYLKKKVFLQNLLSSSLSRTAFRVRSLQCRRPRSVE